MDSDAGTDASVSPPTAMAAKAQPECSSCADSECGQERTACGKDCDTLAWPITPALVPTPDSHDYVKCLANKCDAQCNVLWGCVKAYTWPEPDEAYIVTIRVINAFSDQADTSARVTACQGSDPGCGTGSGMATTGTTDADGYAVLSLDPGFFGYFLVEPQDKRYYPMTMMWSQQIYRVARSFEITLFDRLWVDSMAETLSVDKEDKAAGHLIFRAENCLPMDYFGNSELNAAAENVVVSPLPNGPASSQVFYTGFGLAVDPQQKATKSVGAAYGGVLNLPPGAITVVASHASETVSHSTLRVRPDTLALVHIVPDGR